MSRGMRKRKITSNTEHIKSVAAHPSATMGDGVTDARSAAAPAAVCCDCSLVTQNMFTRHEGCLGSCRDSAHR